MFSVMRFHVPAGIAGARVIPVKARRHLARGEAAVKTAKTIEWDKPAIEKFRNAVRLAPRWPAAHCNL